MKKKVNLLFKLARAGNIKNILDYAPIMLYNREQQ